MLYEEWLNEWMEIYVKISVKERSYKNYMQRLNKYILPELGKCELEELTALRLQMFSTRLWSMGISSSTINSVVTIIKSSLKKGVALGIIEKQYSDVLVRPRLKSNVVSSFTVAEQKKIERYVINRNRPCLFGILLCLYTGLRIGELLALTWDDVDFIKGTVAITKSCHDTWVGNRYIKVFDSTKTACSERIIPLPKKLVNIMRRLRQKTGSKFVVAGRSEYGAQIRSYQRTFELVLKRLNIEHKGFHALRHTFATRALEVGMDVKTLSEILGHRSPSITLARYAHSMLEHKMEMMNKVGRLLG